MPGNPVLFLYNIPPHQAITCPHVMLGYTGIAELYSDVQKFSGALSEIPGSLDSPHPD